MFLQKNKIKDNTNTDNTEMDCFLIHSATFCIFIRVLIQIISKVIIERYVLILVIVLLISVVICVLNVTWSFNSYSFIYFLPADFCFYLFFSTAQCDAPYVFSRFDPLDLFFQGYLYNGKLNLGILKVWVVRVVK